ncbi:hypothetical protein N7G274_001902 [Stereocaulon virgatum]|uniref:BHLH domain-containing protein n=1 Tax=Stereocaulon virgatum TaxID=373712 RepID=A0ABR4AJ09_9LECA
MPFSATETDMNGFPYDCSQDSPSSPDFTYFDNPSYSQPQYHASPLLAATDHEPYFTKPFDDSSAKPFDDSSTKPFDNSSWMNSEDPSGTPGFSNSVLLPVGASPTFRPQYGGANGPSSHDSASSIDSSNCHVDLARITGYETWIVPQPAKEGSHSRNRRLSSPSSPTCSHPQVSRCSSSLALANSDNAKPNGQPNGRSTPSTPPEEQIPRKRRRNSTGLPATEPDAELEDIRFESKTKPSAKVSHSVIERRYRENLNAKITQLDQALTSVRQAGEGQPEAPGKARKADVINEAMRYVKQAKVEGESRNKEIEFLRLRVAALEKLVHCGDCALLKQFAGQHIHDSTKF